jgi:hypothetical protein
MNGFKSRKFILAFIFTVAGMGAAVGLPALPAFAWLREHTMAIMTAVAAMVGAYIAGNAIVDWVHKGNGGKGTGDAG